MLIIAGNLAVTRCDTNDSHQSTNHNQDRQNDQHRLAARRATRSGWRCRVIGWREAARIRILIRRIRWWPLIGIGILRWLIRRIRRWPLIGIGIPSWRLIDARSAIRILIGIRRWLRWIGGN